MAGQKVLIEVRVQKNSTVLLRAPDDSFYPFEIDPKAPDEKVLAKIGKTVLEILADPEMPEAVITPAGGAHQAAGGAGATGGDLEHHVRAAADSVVPGASRLLDFLQAISSDPDEETG